MALLRSFFVCAALSLLGAAAQAYDLEANRNERFSRCIHDLEERPLEPVAHDRSVEVYRLLYLPSFFPQVSMRVNVWPSGAGRMTLRAIPPYCGDRNPSIEERKRGLSAADVNLVRDAFSQADFWNLATTEDGEGGERVVCSDGAGFHMEGLRDGKYHRISRSCVWSNRLDQMLMLFHRLARTKDPHRTDHAP